MTTCHQYPMLSGERPAEPSGREQHAQYSSSAGDPVQAGHLLPAQHCSPPWSKLLFKISSPALTSLRMFSLYFRQNSRNDMNQTITELITQVCTPFILI
jgi:hypothetical protein